MKIRLLKTGDVLTVHDSYGMRLIEQGKAVVAIPEKKPTLPKKESAAKPAGDA